MSPSKARILGRPRGKIFVEGSQCVSYLVIA